MKIIKKSIVLFIIVEIILTGLTFYADTRGDAFCFTGSGCDAVQNSDFGTMFGIKLSLLGLMAFIFVLLIYMMSHYYKRGHHLVLIAFGIGGVSALYFMYLQIFVLRQICSSCMAIDMLMIIILVYAIYDFISHKKLPSRFPKDTHR